MTQSLRKIRLPFFLLLMLLTVISCDTEDNASVTDVENLADASIENIQSRVVGKKHCVEFVFPITIEFADSSTAEVDDYTDLYETIVNWFTDNDVEKSRDNLPSIVYPLEVVNQDGEIIQVNSEEEFKTLKSECPREGKCKDGKRGNGFSCFDIVFPIEITIDGETLSIDDKEALKDAFKTYKETAEEGDARPELVFPITVSYEDGNTVEVESKDALKELKEECQDN